jgi:glutamine synthetase
MSVYLGDQLESVFGQLKMGTPTDSKARSVMHLGVGSLPTFAKDTGDRNRTSPFAFTGNRFEFRAVGSGSSIAGPLVAMNTMLADSLTWMAEKLEAAMSSGVDLNSAITATLKTVMEEHGAVIFGGDGYSEAWHKEAEARGLANLRTTAEALPVLRTKEVQELFKKTGVLTPVELESRFEVYSEQYLHSIDVESKVVISMAKTLIYPAAMKYLASLTTTASALSGLGIESSKSVMVSVSAGADQLLAGVEKLEAAKAKHDFDSIESHLTYCAHTIRPLMDEIRGIADGLEAEIGDEFWPIPTYEEMLFIK